MKKRQPRRDGKSEESKSDRKSDNSRTDRKSGKPRSNRKFSDLRSDRKSGESKPDSKSGKRSVDKKFSDLRSDRKSGKSRPERKSGETKSGRKFSDLRTDQKSGKPRSENKPEGSYQDKKASKARPDKKHGKPNKVGKGPAKPQNPVEETKQQGASRLNKYIANSGVCSRRDADKLIAAGEIKINGNIVTELGTKVNPGDTVTYKGKKLKAEKNIYILLNKPKDFITTTDDPQNRKTVMELVKNAAKERIYPVGRLDRNTTGLLLFTNDGDLAKKLAHPSHMVKKIYKVELDKPITTEDFNKILDGLTLEDGQVSVDQLAILDNNKSLGVEIHLGRNRIVRRIFEHLGYDVVKLDRVMYANLDKSNLPRGKWRELSEKEIIQLKHLK